MGMKNECYSCKDGERTADGPTFKTTVSEPWNDGPPVTGYLCEEHITAAEDDGMIVKEQR